ncbi:MAG: Flp pilus assembly complex ATPase component TadA [Candidatus Aenigmarchaeota archaeon]|nr:Flp pilus assembly complex ATPase component TadA [Candidatus Aenigmarchaeota archaeon]
MPPPDEDIAVPEAVFTQEKGSENPSSEGKNNPIGWPKRLKDWMAENGWFESPFTFSIKPDLYVGYEEQKAMLLSAIEEKHNISLVTGPTGSGKTTLLKWATMNVPKNFDVLYAGKPPANTQELVDIFNNKYGAPWFLRLFMPNIKNPYQIPDFMNRKLRGKHMVFFLDEAHEAELEMLEWIRVLSDQIDNMTIILSGLPVFEPKIRDKLETLRKRIVARIEVLSLTKTEMERMIAMRIESVGGKGHAPFDQGAIDAIYEKTGGFPREVLRVCTELINAAARQGRSAITVDMVSARKEEEKSISVSAIEALTPMQRDVIEVLAAGPASPGDIANRLPLEKYKTRQHAVRSVNNILIRMMAEKMVERTRKDRAFVYHLAAKLKTLVVKA